MTGSKFDGMHYSPQRELGIRINEITTLIQIIDIRQDGFTGTALRGKFEFGGQLFLCLVKCQPTNQWTNQPTNRPTDQPTD